MEEASEEVSDGQCSVWTDAFSQVRLIHKKLKMCKILDSKSVYLVSVCILLLCMCAFIKLVRTQSLLSNPSLSRSFRSVVRRS